MKNGGPPIKDRIGQEFYWLTVIADGLAEIDKKGHRIRTWLCRCECGNERSVRVGDLISGKTKSCGCKNFLFNKTKKGEARQASLNALFGLLKTNAKRRSLEFTITKDHFNTLRQAPCHYCGIDPFSRFNTYISKTGLPRSKHITQQASEGWIVWNGMDRSNSDIGYVPGNVVSCCKWCNYAKSNRSASDFLTWIEQFCAFQEAH